MPMARFVGLVRAINLGRANVVKMADLQALLRDAGCKDAKTLLQTGNFVFEGTGRGCAEWESKFKSAAQIRFGLTTEFFVRSHEQWEMLTSENPFVAEAANDPSRVFAVVFKNLPTRAEISELCETHRGEAWLHLGRTALFVHAQQNIGISKVMTSARWKKTVGVGTMRNWNTVSKLLRLLQEKHE